MANIQDVARAAGVAPITVSRVINNSGYVAAEVRARVEAAVAELGYVPNRLASSLRSRRSHTLALVLSDITNPFFTTMTRGVEDAASERGYMVIVGNTDEREAEELKRVRLLVGQRVDGVLLVPARHGAQSLALLAQQRTPVVVLDRRVESETVDVVRCDSEGGARQLGELLRALGHMRVALLTGPAGVSTSDDRVAACRGAFGADADCRVYHGEFTPASGAAMTRQALAVEPRPTALFAANNFITIGALRALHELGLSVPEEVALVGFDDLPEALVTFPFLTVAAQPAYEMGRQAVDLLLARLEGDESAPRREVVLPSELIVRQSSGAPREQRSES